MLTLNDWLSIKRKLLTNYMSNYSKNLLRKKSLSMKLLQSAKDKMTADNAAVEGVMGVSLSNGEGLFSKNVRVFKVTTPKKEENNIAFGSSIVAKLEEDKSLPQDCSVHAYRGSTTKEKLKILNDYPNKRLKTFILHNGTNSILKFNKSAGDIFSELNELVIKCNNKFEPDLLLMCEVPPLKNRLANSDKNKMIDEFNELLLEKFDKDSMGFDVLKLNQIIRITSNSHGNVQDYNQLFHDNVHLNCSLGVPMFKNLRSYLQRISSGLVNASSKM